MSTEREQLMKTIIDNPKDDQPRLVFADWLEEQGESERAELIRAQIELACLDSLAPLPRKRGGNRVPRPEALRRKTARLRLKKRIKELLSCMLDQSTATQRIKERAEIVWAKPVLGYYIYTGKPVFHRGFVEEVTMPWDAFREQADRIRSITPLCSVQLTRVPVEWSGQTSGTAFNPTFLVLMPIQPCVWAWLTFERMHDACKAYLATQHPDIEFEVLLTPPA